MVEKGRVDLSEQVVLETQLGQRGRGSNDLFMYMVHLKKKIEMLIGIEISLWKN